MAKQDSKADSLSPHPSSIGTFAMCVFLGIAYATIDPEGSSPYATVNLVAKLVAIGLSLSLAFDTLKGFRSMIRVDVLCLLALYTLTFLEFLFPQEGLDAMANPIEIAASVKLILLGFGGLILGRHFIKPISSEVKLFLPEFSPQFLLLIFWGSIAIGSLHMWLAVSFNPVDFFDGITASRWKLPWARGSLGGWKELLNEFALLFYIIPPLTGIIFAKRKQFKRAYLTSVLIGFLYIIFIAICGGTRSVLGAHAATFLISYFISHPKPTLKRIIAIGAITTGIVFFCFYHMLEFRQIGVRRYVEILMEQSETKQPMIETRDTLFIDFNVFNLSLLTEVFPSQYDYLGLEVPYVAITKPIPRAIWKGKPIGLSVGIEEAAGLSGLTLAVTYIGEAYVSGGPFAVIFISLLLGTGMAYWNRLASKSSSSYGLLVYASGAFAGVICMRSIIFISTCTLPTIALLVLSWYISRQPSASKWILANPKTEN